MQYFKTQKNFAYKIISVELFTLKQLYIIKS